MRKILRTALRDSFFDNVMYLYLLSFNLYAVYCSHLLCYSYDISNYTLILYLIYIYTFVKLPSDVKIINKFKKICVYIGKLISYYRLSYNTRDRANIIIHIFIVTLSILSVVHNNCVLAMHIKACAKSYLYGTHSSALITYRRAVTVKLSRKTKATDGQHGDLGIHRYIMHATVYLCMLLCTTLNGGRRARRLRSRYR